MTDDQATPAPGLVVAGKLRRLRRRWWLLAVLTRGMLIAAVGCTALTALTMLDGSLAGSFPAALAGDRLWLFLLTLGGSFVVAILWSALGAPSVAKIARFVDAKLGLADRLGTALERSGGTSVVERALLEDAAQHARALDVSGLLPFKAVRRPTALLAAASLSFALAASLPGGGANANRFQAEGERFSRGALAGSVTRLAELVEELADQDPAATEFQPIARALSELGERTRSGAMQPRQLRAELRDLLGQLARAAAVSDPELARLLADLEPSSQPPGRELAASAGQAREEEPFRFDSSPTTRGESAGVEPSGEDGSRNAAGFEADEVFRTLGEVVAELEKRAGQDAEARPAPRDDEAGASASATGTSTYYTDRDEAREAELAVRREALRQRGQAGSEVAGAAHESTDDAGAMAGEGHQPLDVGAGGMGAELLELTREEITLELAERPDGDRSVLFPEPAPRFAPLAEGDVSFVLPAFAGTEGVTRRDGPTFLHRDLIERHNLPGGSGREGR